MYPRVLGLMLGFALLSYAHAQQGSDFVEAEVPRATYFLIDSSGSMADKNAEIIVTKLLEEISEVDPSAPVSRTYFRAADGNACWQSVEINPLQPASRSAPLNFEFEDDFTPMGEALKAALLHAVERGSPADIYLVSDEDPTPGCGIDICTVASAYLPLPNINVTSIQTDPRSLERHDRLGCIEAAEARPEIGVTIDQREFVSKRQQLSVSSQWDDAGFWERWSWLIVFSIAVASAFAFTRRVILKAHAYEKRSEEIQERQRALLTGQGSESEHKDQITLLSKFSDPEPKAWRAVGRGLASLSFALVLILTFTEEHFFWFWTLGENNRLWFVELDTARNMAWLVLSSGFSNAFAILGITPILFMFSQNWRYLQSKRTFEYVSGNAAEEEAKARNQEIEDLFQELNTVRGFILQSTLQSRWADPPKKYRVRKLPDKFNGEDRENLEEVKRRLLELAQGPEPKKEGQSPQSLAKQIAKLSSFAPRSKWRNHLKIECLISDLIEEGWISSHRDRWSKFKSQIEKREHRAIKSSLKFLASYDEE